MTSKNTRIYRPASFAPGINTVPTPNVANLLGQSVRFDQWDNTYPWEKMILHLYILAGATAPTSLTVDGIMGLIRNINLQINDGVRPRSVVNGSGIFFLEYALATGMNLDTATLALIAEHSKGTPSLTASNLYHVAIPINFVHPMITGTLRQRMLLPVHKHKSSPVLSLDFSTAAQMFSTGSITNVSCEVEIVRREIPNGSALDDGIMAGGGYVNFDLVEVPYTMAAGLSGVQRFKINGPGQYATLLLRQYLGGSTVTRGDISRYVSAGNQGAETVWSLQTAGQTLREWSMKMLKAENERSRPLNSISQTSSPNIVGALASVTQYQEPVSVLLDFLTDETDGVAELGSLLDVESAERYNNKMELVGEISNVATNGSTLYMGGHRYFSPELIAKWKLQKPE